MEYFKGLSRKEYIIKANELIKRDGIENISIRKIARELGCSSASLYRYFANLDELVYYAQLGELKDYIVSLNEAAKVWENVWDMYVGVWYCYAMEAFRKPVAYNLLFLTKPDMALKYSIEEYYNMFPEDILRSSQVFQTMLRNPDFQGRDYEVCKECMKAGALSAENALILNRMVCMLYIGYFKTLMDKGIEEERIDDFIWECIEDIERIVFALADNLFGYTSYREVLKRKKKRRKK